MKIKNLLKKEIDIDVYDDVTEGIGIAFCGAMGVTKEGEKEWGDVLEMDVDIKENKWLGDVALVKVEKYGDDWKKYQKRAQAFFYALAGYCADTDYDKWFIVL